MSKQEQLESAALRKLVYQLAGNPDPDDQNLTQAASTAVERINHLEARLDELEAATGINLENAEYKQLSKPAKVKRVAEAVRRRAHNAPNGKAKYDYNDVKALFDDKASAGHAHDLLELAGQRDGVEFQQHPKKNDRVVVDLEKES